MVWHFNCILRTSRISYIIDSQSVQTKIASPLRMQIYWKSFLIFITLKLYQTTNNKFCNRQPHLRTISRIRFLFLNVGCATEPGILSEIDTFHVSRKLPYISSITAFVTNTNHILSLPMLFFAAIISSTAIWQHFERSVQTSRPDSNRGPIAGHDWVSLNGNGAFGGCAEETASLERRASGWDRLTESLAFWRVSVMYSRSLCCAVVRCVELSGKSRESRVSATITVVHCNDNV